MLAVRILIGSALVCACGRPSTPTPAPGSGTGARAEIGSAIAIIEDAGSAAVPADAAIDRCSAAAVARVRAEAEVHMKARRYEAAVALLDANRCLLEADQPEDVKLQIAWLISDLSFAHHKAGEHAKCFALAGGQMTPHTGNVGEYFEGHAVVRALEHNAALCEAAAAKERGPFSASIPCGIAEDALGVPPDALDAGDTEACLVIAPGKQGTGEDADMHVCGAITLVRERADGKRSRTKLVAESGNLADGSYCCNVEGVEFSRRGKQLALLVTTAGENCHGGTAVSVEHHAYKLVGKQLVLFHELRAAMH